MCPRSRLRIWSCEIGSAVPFRVDALTVRTQAESGNYSRAPLVPLAFRDMYYYIDTIDKALIYTTNRHRVRVYRVTQLRIDGVYQESADIEPVVLKVVGVTGAAFSGIKTVLGERINL